MPPFVPTDTTIGKCLDDRTIHSVLHPSDKRIVCATVYTNVRTYWNLILTEVAIKQERF